MKKVVIAVISALFLLSVVPHAQADSLETHPQPTFAPDTIASGVEHIRSYGAQISIHTDGTIGISEQILYNFPSPKHGIFRVLPLIKTNADGKDYRLMISDITVTDERQTAYPYTQTSDSNTLTLKIGNPDETITGEHWYIIGYTVSGALTYFSDHDELYWNAIGTEWNVPITRGDVRVGLPKEFADSEVKMACYTGATGSDAQNCTLSHTGQQIQAITTQSLGSNEGFTVVVGFPPGVVSRIEPAVVVPFFSTLTGKIVLAVGIVLGFLWYIVAPIAVVRKWWTGGRDPKPSMGEVKAWFAPPQTETGRDLTPAETGGLIDETVDMRDIYGTIIDLARRGFIKITETSKGKFSLTKLKAWDGTVTQPFERQLLAGIFTDGKTVNLSDLNLQQTIHTVTNTLYLALVSDGLFPKNPQTIRIWYIVLAVVSAITFNPILLIVSLTFGLHMPRKTLFGSDQAAVARSLKNFLSSQDKQLAFQAKNQMMFEKLLPYAIAFGVEVIWAKRFADVALTRPTWYASSTGNTFNSVIFAQSLGRGYAGSFVGAATYKSSSGFSSGFSGGFSGGGGGGGGGGSW